ncbi:uncharacterized protein C5orf34 homolog [Otolemur garnettii]|uniref:uncharacterized protein C5orf34 homolog n=1 Tax=Otolemur garnettii TaxID=30611 RepID=UPI000C7EA9E1|nr:uncharacterized protein C5orf34 homolog [Otolemur garnettii]
MTAEVRMVLYEDDSVQVQYADGSNLQLSPCGSEFLFEKSPPVSAHPLEQPERIRQRTHFVISTYRTRLQRALDFRNSSATHPFLSENIIPSERKKTGKSYTFGNLSRQRQKNKENELYGHIMKSKEPLKKMGCVNGTEGREELPLPRTKPTCVYTWIKQHWSVAACPEEWKYPLSLALCFHNKASKINADITQNEILTSDVLEERGKEISVLPRALLLSCSVPHLHRWNFCNSLSQRQSDEEYSYPELVKVVWYKGVTYSFFHVHRILQHCARTRLSLSHNYRICCWKMVLGINDSKILPLLLKESFIPNVGRFLAYSDDKVHAIFLDGITLTLNWNFSSSVEKRQVNQGLNLGWCKLTFPDGQDQLIQTEYPGTYERYVTTVISWCRRLTQTSPKEMPTHPSSSILEENWSVASELEKIQKFNLLLETSGVLKEISNKKKEQLSDNCKPRSTETLLEEVNEKRVSVALKKTSEILQDIDCLLSNSKK